MPEPKAGAVEATPRPCVIVPTNVLTNIAADISFLMSQIAMLADRAFSEGSVRWLKKCDAYNAGLRTLDLVSKLTKQPPVTEAGTTQLNKLRAGLERIAVSEPCECDHSADTCCAKVDEPCAVCTLALSQEEG